ETERVVLPDLAVVGLRLCLQVEVPSVESKIELALTPQEACLAHRHRPAPIGVEEGMGVRGGAPRADPEMPGGNDRLARARDVQDRGRGSTRRRRGARAGREL